MKRKKPMFSLSYLFKVAKKIIRYPKSLFRAVYGWENVGGYIFERTKREYANNPVSEKKVNGYFIFINPEDRIVISPSIGVHGNYYETAETELLKKIVKKGDIVVDVGANIGWYTLLSAHLTGKNGKVVAFEPEPTNYALLKKSIEKNAFENVLPFNCCASNITGTQTLWLDKENLGANSTVKKISEEAINVEAVTLDSALSKLEIQTVDLLKVDVEGAEPEVFEGAQEYLLTRKIRNIFLEWNGKAWATHEKLLQKLLEYYDIFQIISSPFLVKKHPKSFLYHCQSADLYLKLRE
jgi:FkbM family methyltransferase